MTAENQSSDDSVSLEFLQQIEPLCTRFEEACQSGERPDIAECLGNFRDNERDWLLREDQWRTDRFHSIRVVFADETDHQPEQFAPTIRIKEPLPGQ